MVIGRTRNGRNFSRASAVVVGLYSSFFFFFYLARNEHFIRVIVSRGETLEGGRAR